MTTRFEPGTTGPPAEAVPESSFWRGRRVFVSGATGFVGSWVCWWLYRLGARITGYALPAVPRDALSQVLRLGDWAEVIDGDVRDGDALAAAVRHARPELVLHLAAQPLVRVGLEQPGPTFATNVLGCCRLLDAIRGTGSVAAALVVTSDKCYRLDDAAQPRHEDDALGGHDPYSASKAGAELAVAAYREAWRREGRGVRLATARPGNTLGPGDWAPHRLLPNSIRALARGEPVPVHGAHHVRPWQHVLDLASGLLLLLQALSSGDDAATAWNFGPADARDHTTLEVVRAVCAHWPAPPGRDWIEHSPDDALPEAAALRISIARSRQRLGWQPRHDFDSMIASTVSGYRRLLAHRGHPDEVRLAQALCDDEIAHWLSRTASRSAASA